ncbi:branched-chain amino acid aminotransferase, partial [bacterium]|nr:branched-chain amino acid aminotransferase [bacterium]
MHINYNFKPALERRTEQFEPQENVGFGDLRTDHMFLMDYRHGQWCDPRVIPYGPFEIAPGAIALHYGQSVFEGAKAFRHDDGEIYTFRLD